MRTLEAIIEELESIVYPEDEYILELCAELKERISDMENQNTENNKLINNLYNRQ